ncbi:MAG: glycine zipper family protein [Rhodospirillales bacterium]
MTARDLKGNHTMRTMGGTGRLVGACALSLALAGCAGMTDTQQRAATGTLGGAALGAGIGAIAGNAGMGAVIGAGAGLATGLVVDAVKKNEAAAYRSGYAAGRAQQQ